ncbi:MAG: hypothetical protein JJ992_09940, partial [Planctomycetes bacterium]|nr:hypothetical protein [Planctomycetota bacterium]
MSQVTPQAVPAPLRIVCPCDKETCSGEVVAIDTKYTTEIFVRCAPLRGEASELDFEGQARRFYNCLPNL